MLKRCFALFFLKFFLFYRNAGPVPIARVEQPISLFFAQMERIHLLGATISTTVFVLKTLILRGTQNK